MAVTSRKAAILARAIECVDRHIKNRHTGNKAKAMSADAVAQALGLGDEPRAVEVVEIVVHACDVTTASAGGRANCVRGQSCWIGASATSPARAFTNSAHSALAAASGRPPRS